MEHPPKRRRIVRRLERPPRDHAVTNEGQHTGLHGMWGIGKVLEIQIAPRQLELRQNAPTPVADIVNKVAQPVKTRLATLHASIVENDQTGLSNMVKSVTNSATAVIEPTVTDISYNSTSPTGRKAPTKSDSSIKGATSTHNDVSSHQAAHIPGHVTPLPAEAAASIRNSALQSQEAVAYGHDQVRSQNTTDSTSATVASQSATPTHSAISVPFADQTSQHVLESPSTPLPSTPGTTSASASYFPSSIASISDFGTRPTGSTSSATSRASNKVSNAQQNSTPNPSTSTSTPSGSRTSSHETSTRNAATTSETASTTESMAEASASRLVTSTPSTTISRSPSALAALSRNSKSTLPSRTPTTLMTLKSSSARLSASSTTLPLSSSSQQLSSSSFLSASATSSSGIGPGGIGNTGNTAPTQSPHSTAAAGAGAGGPPPTPVLVGGIIGGVAGLVLILLALLFLLRWRRGKMGQRRLISPSMTQTSSPAAATQSGTGTQRSSNVPIAAAGFFGRPRPSSSQTAATTDTAPSERGFQKISGRKLDPVLQSGGDGYGIASGPSGGPSTGAGRGGGPDQAIPAPGLRPSPPQSLSGSSFYRDSRGFYGGVIPKDESTSDPIDPSTSPTSSSPPQFPSPPISGVRSSEVPNMRPGPARQPVINQPGFLPVRTPSRAQGPPPRPARATPPPILEHPRDGVGRSRPSQDGSRGSRFREVTPSP